MGLPLISALAIAAILLSGGGDEASSTAGQGPDNGDGAEVAGLGTPALGSKNAPVVLTEYSDYQ